MSEDASLTKSTPYQIVLKEKGAKYLRGWMQADRVQDPEGYVRRMGNFMRFTEDLNKGLSES